MSKTFRPWKIDQPLLLPASVQDFVGEDHLAGFVLSLVLESLDLGEIEACYASERGQPPYDPAMMTALLLYAYCNGVYASRRIAKAARERVDFMSIVGLDPQDFRTVSDFRKRHLKALAGLFGQVLRLCEQAGLAKLGHVALDGTKIKANASKHKAMSYVLGRRRHWRFMVAMSVQRSELDQRSKLSKASLLSLKSASERRRVLSSLTEDQRHQLRYDWATSLPPS
jgi:transposase